MQLDCFINTSEDYRQISLSLRARKGSPEQNYV